jgi:hypothetical protein
MPTKQSQSLQFNNFVGGLVTEASLLNFPLNAYRDGENFIIDRDGSSYRRFGIDYEANYLLKDTGLSVSSFNNSSVDTGVWLDVGDDSSLEFLCIRIGNTVYFHDVNTETLSQNFVGSIQISSNFSDKVSFTSVNGKLIIANGRETVTVVEYKEGIFTKTEERLKIRDLFGVQDPYLIDNTEVDLNSGEYINTRPRRSGFGDKGENTLTDQHRYNLRNQSWALPRAPDDKSNGTSVDTIKEWWVHVALTEDPWPSNADITWQGIYTDSDESDPLDAFFPEDIIRNPRGNTAAGKGYFIIDALKRGTDRFNAYKQLMNDYPELEYDIDSLLADTTEGGARVVAEFSGHVFFAGFGGKIIDGDAHSPVLSKYVLFSRLVRNPTDVFKCYQEGDPTSRDESDIVATDGGAIPISGISKIIKLVPIGSNLGVFASNGVWAIRGGSDYGFSADNYSVDRITERGVISEDSIIEIGDSVVYWSDDGIYRLGNDEIGMLSTKNISSGTIQDFYTNIKIDDTRKVRGMYDAIERKVRWVYNTDTVLSNDNIVKELIYDIDLQAFHVSRFYNAPVKTPEVISVIRSDTNRSVENQEEVTVGGSLVTVGGTDVTVSTSNRVSGLNELKYLTIVDVNGNVNYTFSEFNNQQFKDWFTHDGVGVDAFAYFLTGPNTAGDSSKRKQTPYLTLHFEKTESGYQEVGDDYELLTPSSCFIQSRWEWSDSTNSGKWGREFQGYRFRRHYLPDSVNDPFNNGFETVTTRNKIRGRGRSVSFYYKTEPEKDCKILGWVLDLNGNPIT